MQLDRIFDALASRPRREILAYLSKNELTTTELAERFAMSTPAISRHLSVLENAGLVRSERQRPARVVRARARQPGQHAHRLRLRGVPGGGPAQARVPRARAPPQGEGHLSPCRAPLPASLARHRVRHRDVAQVCDGEVRLVAGARRCGFSAWPRRAVVGGALTFSAGGARAVSS